MFKSLISLFFSDFLFPIVIIGSWCICVLFIPSHGVLCGFISTIIWIMVFIKFTSRFDKYK